MTDQLKNLFFAIDLSNIFQKYHWHMLLNSDEKYHFNYRGEIADYYLMLCYNNNTIKFNYTLDIEIPKDKINDLLMLINFVNQKNQDGFFVFDFEVAQVETGDAKQRSLGGRSPPAGNSPGRSERREGDKENI